MLTFVDGNLPPFSRGLQSGRLDQRREARHREEDTEVNAPLSPFA